MTSLGRWKARRRAGEAAGCSQEAGVLCAWPPYTREGRHGRAYTAGHTHVCHPQQGDQGDGGCGELRETYSANLVHRSGDGEAGVRPGRALRPAWQASPAPPRLIDEHQPLVEQQRPLVVQHKRHERRLLQRAPGQTGTAGHAGARALGGRQHHRRLRPRQGHHRHRGGAAVTLHMLRSMQPVYFLPLFVAVPIDIYH